MTELLPRGGWPRQNVRPAHFDFPFQVRDGVPVVVEQDSERDVRACVQAIIRCPTGFRSEEPGFGIDDPTFGEGPIDVGSIEAQVDEWEPRADPTVVEDGIETASRSVSIGVRLSE